MCFWFAPEARNAASERLKPVQINDFRLSANRNGFSGSFPDKVIRVPAGTWASVDCDDLLYFRFSSNMRFIYEMRFAIIFCDVGALNTVIKKA